MGLAQFTGTTFNPIWNNRNAGRQSMAMPGGGFGGGAGGGNGGMSSEWDNESKLAGMISQTPRHIQGLDNSIGVMNGLGGLIGANFGAVNAQNLDTANKARTLNTLGSLLSQFFGRSGGGGGGMGGGRISDTDSRQAVSY